MLDGLLQRQIINRVEFQRAIATFAARVENNSRISNFVFAEVDNQIVIASSLLIPGFHISADDALHLATALIYKCKAFVLDDRDFKNRINIPERISVFNLRDHDDIEMLTDLCEID